MRLSSREQLVNAPFSGRCTLAAYTSNRWNSRDCRLLEFAQEGEKQCLFVPHYWRWPPWDKFRLQAHKTRQSTKSNFVAVRMVDVRAATISIFRTGAATRTTIMRLALTIGRHPSHTAMAITDIIDMAPIQGMDTNQGIMTARD